MILGRVARWVFSPPLRMVPVRLGVLIAVLVVASNMATAGGGG